MLFVFLLPLMLVNKDYQWRCRHWLTDPAQRLCDGVCRL